LGGRRFNVNTGGRGFSFFCHIHAGVQGDYADQTKQKGADKCARHVLRIESSINKRVAHGEILLVALLNAATMTPREKVVTTSIPEARIPQTLSTATAPILPAKSAGAAMEIGEEKS